MCSQWLQLFCMPTPGGVVCCFPFSQTPLGAMQQKARCSTYRPTQIPHLTFGLQTENKINHDQVAPRGCKPRTSTELPLSSSTCLSRPKLIFMKVDASERPPKQGEDISRRIAGHFAFAYHIRRSLGRSFKCALFLSVLHDIPGLYYSGAVRSYYT